MALPSSNPTTSPPPAAAPFRGVLSSPPPHYHHQVPPATSYHHQPNHLPPPRGAYPAPSATRPSSFRPHPAPILHPRPSSAAAAVGSYGHGHGSNAGVRVSGSGPQSGQLTRPAYLHHHHMGPAAGSMPQPIVRGVPVSTYQKVPSSATAHDSNGHKDTRDRSDNSITVRERKVRVSGSSSLYAACRSWLRNGVFEETQPHYLDGIKLLPKPSPPPVPDAHSPAEQEPNKEEEEDDESVEHLSPADLLQRHVKRAKKVRSRLREERLQRIARYKTRLALLLPPLVEQQHQFRNESADRH